MLELDVFTTNGEYFLQECGTAMGSKMAPCYANIFMTELAEYFCVAIHKNLLHSTDILSIFVLSGLTAYIFHTILSTAFITTRQL